MFHGAYACMHAHMQNTHTSDGQEREVCGLGGRRDSRNKVRNSLSSEKMRGQNHGVGKRLRDDAGERRNGVKASSHKFNDLGESHGSGHKADHPPATS